MLKSVATDIEALKTLDERLRWLSLVNNRRAVNE